MIEVVVFDFDGVLVDSVHVKTDAFMALYEGYGPEVVDEVRAHHLANGGVSRYRKLEHYERTLLHRDPTPEAIDALAGAFAARVVEAVVAADEVPGASRLLGALHGLVPLFVASGTPEDELRQIVARRGWAHMFDGVFGSPPTKAEILSTIAERTGRPPARLMMVGDSVTDLEGARAAGTAFVGLAGDEAMLPADAETVRDLDELRRVVFERVTSS